MKEIEVKILKINKEEVIKKIEALGAKKVFDGELSTEYFKGNNLKKQGKVLRLRRKNNKTIITYKEKVSFENAKIMDEFETEVKDYDMMKRIFEGLGYKQKRISKKHRISYALDDVTFEIDELPDIPAYLEIEAKTEEILYMYLNALGFKKENANSWTEREVIDYYDK